MLEFVTIGDASVGKYPLLFRLTDQRLLTDPDATVNTFLSINAQPMVSWMSLATGKGRMTMLGFMIARCGIWKQIDIHSGRRQDHQTAPCVFDLYLDC